MLETNACDPRRWAVLGVLCLAVLVVGLDITVLNVALPTIVERLDASTAELQWIVDAYVLAFARRDAARRRCSATASAGGACCWREWRCSASRRRGRRCADSVGRADRRARRDGCRRRGRSCRSPIAYDPRHLRARRAVARDRADHRGGRASGCRVGPIVGGCLLQSFAWSSVFWVNVPVIGGRACRRRRAAARTRRPAVARRRPTCGGHRPRGGQRGGARVHARARGPSAAGRRRPRSAMLGARGGAGRRASPPGSVASPRRLADAAAPAQPALRLGHGGGRRSSPSRSTVCSSCCRSSSRAVLGNDALGTGVRLIPLMAGPDLRRRRSPRRVDASDRHPGRGQRRPRAAHRARSCGSRSVTGTVTAYAVDRRRAHALRGRRRRRDGACRWTPCSRELPRRRGGDRRGDQQHAPPGRRRARRGRARQPAVGRLRRARSRPEPETPARDTADAARESIVGASRPSPRRSHDAARAGVRERHGERLLACAAAHGARRDPGCAAPPPSPRRRECREPARAQEGRDPAARSRSRRMRLFARAGLSTRRPSSRSPRPPTSRT